jgi:F-type H+-transporting ATPase subunit b
MSDLLQQLGGLVLGAVPTMFLFLVTLAAYRLLVHTPLTKVLRERYSKTQGAIESAAAAVAAAEQTTEYEERLRTARAEVFHVRHERLSRIHQELELALAEARAAAQEKTAAARIAIEDSTQAARLELDGLIGDLTAVILKRILPAETASPQEQTSQEQAG